MNNGGCSHFCAVTSSSPLCVCPTGFALKQDERTCENSKSFLAVSTPYKLLLFSCISLLEQGWRSGDSTRLPPIFDNFPVNITVNYARTKRSNTYREKGSDKFC